MLVHQLKPNHKSKSGKRVGRGGKKGTYSGKGGKGQTARSGRKLAPIIRELIKRYPKLKGYRAKRLRHSFAPVNLDIISDKFNDNEVVSPESLVKMGIIRTVKGKNPEIKILGNGELKKKLIIENCKISEKAKEAVIKAGGEII